MNSIVNSQHYFPNTGSGGLVYQIATLLSAIVLMTLYFTGGVVLPLWLALLPLIQFVIRVWLFTLLLNVFHMALRSADNDCRLDEIAESNSTTQSILTADAFLSKVAS